jgi:5-methylcytosine-specific restriction endonuclease McrA
MPSRIKSIRRRAYFEQRGICWYCGAPMWLESPLDVPLVAPSSSAALALQCTAEHLKARSEGGRDAPANIVAACFKCNRTRHITKKPLEPEAYRRYVRNRMAKGLWHLRWVHTAMSSYRATTQETVAGSELGCKSSSHSTVGR